MTDKIILGFDASSTTIGYAVLSLNEATKVITFLNCGYIKPIKTGHIIERLADTRRQVQAIIKDVKPDYIAIEEIIQFLKGKSTAKTIIMLTTFNRMIGLASFDYASCPPEMFNVMSIRHGLKINGIVPKKQDMAQLVSQHLNIQFPYEVNKKGKPIIENEDKADAVAVALYQAFILTGKVIRKIKKPKKKKVKKVK